LDLYTVVMRAVATAKLQFMLKPCYVKCIKSGGTDNYVRET